MLIKLLSSYLGLLLIFQDLLFQEMPVPVYVFVWSAEFAILKYKSNFQNITGVKCFHKTKSYWLEVFIVIIFGDLVENENYSYKTCYRQLFSF